MARRHAGSEDEPTFQHQMIYVTHSQPLQAPQTWLPSMTLTAINNDSDSFVTGRLTDFFGATIGR